MENKNRLEHLKLWDNFKRWNIDNWNIRKKKEADETFEKMKKRKNDSRRILNWMTLAKHRS